MAIDSTRDPADVSGQELESSTPKPTIEDLLVDLTDVLEESIDTDPEARHVQHLLIEAHDRGLIPSRVRSLDTRDAAEAFVGSVIFSAPLLVEDGVFDIADHLGTVTIATVPVFFVLNTAFVVLMTYALIEWTGRNRAETRMVLGVIPVRLLMTLVVSFLVATLMMTIWGRIDGWGSPVESILRISVIWTVGSLGAALGDIVSEGDPDVEITLGELSKRSDVFSVDSLADADSHWENHPGNVQRLSDGALLEEIVDRLQHLEASAEVSSNRQDIGQLRERTNEAAFDGPFGESIQKYTSRDVAEGFVGSIFFSIPLLVEDGVYDVAAFFLSFRLGIVPVFFLANTVFVFVMILGIVFWAGPQNVQMTRPIFGFIPRRLVGAAVVSFLTATALMTMWGRVENWNDPVVALARISVLWTVAAFGASLGDVLPGESTGTDINDDLAALRELPSDRTDTE